MTKAELLHKLYECRMADQEAGHCEADKALIEYINDPEIAKAYEFPKWYA